MTGPDPVLDPAAARRVLGLEPMADAAAVARAFARAVKAAHPDRPGGDGERLRAVIEARRVLRGAATPGPEPEPAFHPVLTISPDQAMRGGWSQLRLGERGVRVRLPAGLRAGDLVRVGGERFVVATRHGHAAWVAGDDVVVMAAVEPRILRQGGRLELRTPQGAVSCWISAVDAGRGFVRLCGRGLPARGRRPAGDLIVRLEVASEAPRESLARIKLKRFAEAWAA